MMSCNRRDYASASEWLSALKQDEAWLGQQQRLLASPAKDVSIHREDAIRRIGKGETFEFWEIYGHQVEPVVNEVWEIAELSLPKLKIQAIGMLSMEWLEQHVPTGKQTSKKSKKTTSEKETEKTRELMTLKRSSKVLEGHLTLLYQKLTKEGWIDGYEANFKNLFSNQRDENCQLKWKGLYGKGTLVELFKQMAGAGLIEVPQGFTLSAILEGHFKDKKGQWLTGLDKGDAANDKAMPVIQECVNLLKISPDADCDDLDDEFRSEYDEYDQQDLHWHKR